MILKGVVDGDLCRIKWDVHRKIMWTYEYIEDFTGGALASMEEEVQGGSHGCD